MITALNATGYTYVVNHYFGTSVTYENGKYKLVNPLEIESATNLNDISTHHYICVSPGQKECSTVAYVYYIDSGTMYYITLKDGETSVNTALDKMFNQNTTSSIMKVGLEAWYERNLLSYSSYIEDTIYCNDRSYKNFESSGWNENGGNINTYLQFKEYYSVTSDLSCTKQSDQFSTSNESAKLKYPIGLATSPEMNILNNKTVRKTGQWYWLGSPNSFYDYPYVRDVHYDGYIGFGYYVYDNGGVRPVVSLISGTEYVSGDGSTDNPYIVE
jgi:hypothetical protein